MNKSEAKAKRWLLEKKGYLESEMVFQRARTPDFLCADGKSFEVKRLYSNTIWFYDTQVEQIRNEEDCFVVVISDEEEPIAIIKSEQIRDGAIIAGVRVKVIEKTNETTVKLKGEVLERVLRERAKRERETKEAVSIAEVVKEIILR